MNNDERVRNKATGKKSRKHIVGTVLQSKRANF